MEPLFKNEISFFYYHDSKSPFAYFKKDSLIGFIDKKGKILIKPRYNSFRVRRNTDFIFLIKDSLTSVFNRKLKKIVLKNINASIATIDANFRNEIILSEANYIKKYNFRGALISSNKKVKFNHKYSSKNSSGAGILNSSSSNCDEAKRIYMKKLKNIDSEFELIQSLNRDNDCNPTLSIISKYGKHGIINDKFKLILELSYDEIIYLYNDESAIIRKENKYGFFNVKKSKIILPVKYKTIKPQLITYGNSGNLYISEKENYLLIENETYSGYADKATGEVYFPK